MKFLNLESLFRYSIVVALLLMYSCETENVYRKIDTVEGTVTILRVDSLVNSFKNQSDSAVQTKIESFLGQHASFIEAYNRNVIKVGTVYSKDYNKNLQSFLHYPFYDELQTEINKKFSDISDLKKDVNVSFCRYKSVYPDFKIPSVYFFNGGFNQSVIIVDNGIGIGLDKYLGIDCPFYSQMGMQNYLIKKMYPEKIHSDLIIGFLQGEFPFNFKDENLLANMIHSGRIMYFTKCLLSEKNDSLLWGYSGKDLIFLENSEDDMWMYLVDNKLLFDSDYMTITKMIGEGPFTAYFSKESPSRTGVWLGYKIVCAYMKNNENISISELMNESDYQKIMNKSKYNP